MSDETKRILLIEEDATLLEITAFRLELLGYQVITQQSAEDALAWLNSELPDLILLDQFLPDMDGVDLLNRLSNDMRMSEVPVMLLSAKADLDDVQKAFNAGADDFLVTPYDPVVLEEKVDRLAVAVEEEEE